ncbi:MAG: leucine-rich repeat domain-containing protein [Clostridia bacterium]|nr:leucine-rich repeat domain-containing protein [Clostridia bacterium]
MNKRALILTVLLAGLLLICSFSAYAAETLAGGKYGDDFTWKLDSDGVLTIGGQGDLYDDMDWSDVFWEADVYCDMVEAIVLQNGITGIGSGSLYDFYYAERISIPPSVTRISDELDDMDVYITDLAAWCRIDFLNENGYGSESNLYLNGVSAKDLTIPSGITRINSRAFYGFDNIETVVIPASVTEIGDFAFADCEGLKNVRFSEGLKVIGYWAFYESTLTEITIPASVESMDDSFYECGSLRTVTFADGIKNIPAFGIYACSLTDVYIPSSVTCIGDEAFKSDMCINIHVDSVSDWLKITLDFGEIGRVNYYSSEPLYTLYADGRQITALVIPDGTEKIGNFAFAGFGGFTSVTIPESVKQIGAYAFTEVKGVSSIVIPKYTTEIGAYAFENMKDLKSVSMTGALRVVGEYAFYGCESLTEVVFPENVTEIGHDALGYCSQLKKVVLPEGIKSIEDGMFAGCRSLTSIPIPDSVSAIGEAAFYGCAGLAQIDLPQGLTKIQRNTFYDCSRLSAVVLPNGIDVVGEEAFSGCTSLASAALSEDLGYIGTKAFFGCTSLSSIEIPEKVYRIADQAFSGCASLTSVTFLGAAPDIAENAFDDVSASAKYSGNSASWTSNKRINYGGSLSWSSFSGSSAQIVQIQGTCGDGVNWLLNGSELVISGTGYMDNYDYRIRRISDFEIDSEFWEWEITPYYAPAWSEYKESITSVRIEGKVLNIGNYAFCELENLSKITLCGSIQSIGNYAFFQCDKLTGVALTGGLQSIRDYAFYGCSSLSSVDLPSTVTEIGYACFSQCDSITSFQWPDNIKEISRSVFEYCDSLKTVSIPNGVTLVGSNAFYGCKSLTSITFPDSVERMEFGVITDCPSLTYVNLGKGLKYMDGCFNGCTSLKEVTFPKSLTEMDNSFFMNCSGVSLHFMGDLPYLTPYFSLDSVDMDIYYPAGNSTWNTVIRSGSFRGGTATWHPSVYDKTSLSDCKITLSANTFTYDGQEKKPSVTVRYSGQLISEGTGYELKYENNQNAGTAAAVLTGVGLYEGEVRMEFTISPAKSEIAFRDAAVTKKPGDASFINPVSATGDGNITYASNNAAVAVADASSGRIAILRAGSAVITATLSPGTNYLGANASFTLTVEEGEPSKLLSVSDLSYSFGNTKSAFGYSGSYRIPMERYLQFFTSTEAKVLYNTAGTWNGSCYGMAASSSMFNTEGSGLALREFGKDHIGKLSTGTYSSVHDMDVKEMIETVFVSQYADSVQNCYRRSTNLNDLCEEVEKAETTGRAVILGIFRNSAGHALLAYKIDKINSRTSRMYVYDCNFPNENLYVTLYTDNAGNYTGWYYNLNKSQNWGSDYSNCKITYIPYSVYQSVWEGRSGNSGKKNFLAINSDNFEIRDYSGAVLATMSDGSFKSTTSSIYEFKALEANRNSETLIYMPTDVYEIVNYDEGTLSADMVNKYQSASVSTDASSVVFAVVDEDECNMVYVNAGENETYSVEMTSELSSADGMESLKLSGFGGQDTVVFGLQSGSFYMSNCTGVSLWVNGKMLASSESEFQRNIDAYDIELEYEACGYDGGRKEPEVTVSLNGFTLERNVDFVVNYMDNTEIGTASVVIYGIGAYSGNAFRYFEIMDASSDACANGHYWNRGEYAQDSLYGIDGVMTYTCMVCGEVKTEKIYGYEYNLIDFADEYVTISFKNNTEDPVSGKLCIVVYDAKGEIAAFGIKNVAFAAGDTGRFDVDVFGDKPGAKVKAFILDEISYAPIGEAWTCVR